MRVVYDGSFEGYLSLVYEVYYNHLRPSFITKKEPQNSLFDDELLVLTCKEVYAQKVLESLKKKFASHYFQTLLNIFMCDESEFELPLLEYIILGFKDQKQLSNINHSCVFFIENLQKELFRNYHKMSGFLRFEELEDGTLYAKIDSRFNLVYFLAKHFNKRLNNQKFIIHDIKRELAFVKSEEFFGVRQVESFDSPELSKDEEKFKKLWHTFFLHVSIQSRENKKLQRQVVPLLYRTYMSEFML